MKGNTAAQILLSSIARAEHTHIAVTQGLQRRERIALLREDVGLSGRDWLQRASEISPLAQAQWSYISPAVGRGYDLDAVDILVHHGEIRHGFRALNNLAAQSLNSRSLSSFMSTKMSLAPGASRYSTMF